jgi:hypothetical protein
MTWGHVELDLSSQEVPNGFAILVGSQGVYIVATPLTKDIRHIVFQNQL